MGGWNEAGITTSLVSIMDHFHAPSVIDYLSLDVEGAEESVLRGFDFLRFSVRVMTIERPSAALANLLVRWNYHYVCENSHVIADELWVNLATFKSLGPGRHRVDRRWHRPCADVLPNASAVAAAVTRRKERTPEWTLFHMRLNCDSLLERLARWWSTWLQLQPTRSCVHTS